MAARAYQYAELLGVTADSGATYTTITSVTFTPDASSDYMVMYSCAIQNTASATADAKVRLQDTTNTITYHEINAEMKEITTPDDWIPCFGHAVFTTGGSPASTTYAIQFAAETAADVCNIYEARILIIKLDADDEFVYTAANSDHTSGTYTDVQSLTFTPGTTGDYLVIMSMDYTNSSGTGDTVGARMLDSDAATARGECNPRTQKDPTTYWSWGTMIKKTGVSGSTTYKAQTINVSNAGDTIRARNRCIVALRLDKWDNQYYAETRGRSTSTSTTYQDGAQLIQTPLALDHAIFMCGNLDGSSATISNYMRGLKTATAKTESIYEPVAANEDFSFMHFEKETLAASSTTWTVQARSETTSTTTGRAEMAIAVLQLGATPVAAPGPAFPHRHAFQRAIHRR